MLARLITALAMQKIFLAFFDFDFVRKRVDEFVAP
jgi:hypothetical protein